MKKKRKNYLVKGIYSHPQVEGYLSVMQYMIVEQDEKRCLLIRFANESGFVINGVEFILKQLNARGEIIAEDTIKLKGLSIKKDCMYSLENGIVIDRECDDFIVQMVSLISGEYKYKFAKGRVTAHYDRRGYEEPKRSKHRTPKANVTRAYWGDGKYYRFIALVCTVLIALAMAFVFYRAMGTAGTYSVPTDPFAAYTDSVAIPTDLI